ncbi:MAG: glucose-phosphatase [Chloroflexota bacterium]|nr:glucose-phosphatase [Chloroflexota bacterium]
MEAEQVVAERWIAFDAMGVIFEESDDVAAHLIPFVQERNPRISKRSVRMLYDVLVLGEITSAQFWRSLDLPEDSDAEYLQRYRLDPGFLPHAREWAQSLKLGMISNDAAEWSAELRRLHGLNELISVAAVSGECGARKPDAAIFREFLQQSGAAPAACLFVDDRDANLSAAQRMGFTVVLFERPQFPQQWGGRRVQSFDELAPIVEEWRTT